MVGIELEDVSKCYGSTKVIDKINLTIKEGERVIFLGPSGCGKSTTLRMIAGLEEVTSGHIYLGGKEVTPLPSGQRDIAMVFQNYALYPNMTVQDNITFALRANKVAKSEIQERLNSALEMLDLVNYRDRLPKDLSGGQRQRVALARALVKRSKFFLLDEPLSNLDVALRQSARNQLIEIHDRYQQTFVYVTHDQVEAMTMGHRIVLMNKGEIQMVGTPDEVYNHPANVFTATFIGSPKMNIQEVSRQGNLITVGKQELHLSSEWGEHLSQFTSQNFLLGIRPEHIHIYREKVDNSFLAHVSKTENLGPNYAIYVETNSTQWVVISDIRNWQPGEECYLTFEMDKIHLFDVESKESMGYPSFS
ncbi:ABC transporter ATP-binding protein [Facklamia sp. DSM 111018]|uniref:ABC transporter ATP-binding protein n=1 Tax=Facklamia lactis TaxID=2749967 RepID=A0ABS0LNJ6_9LACT|nr:ABC transporter ATP-binding protein [Facklamia lactis]MBG9979589.1 ABC transporter ATP-binding protein [Facklamia lactis]MBG9985731.1 ABC transporter ATP-binding protein [Facklamia lactis]